jgi:hypothetical protein
MKRVIHLLAAMVTIGLLGTGDGLLGENQGAEAQADSRPNFVFVVTDDLDERAMEQLGGIRVVMGTNGTTSRTPTSPSPYAALLGPPCYEASIPTTTA